MGVTAVKSDFSQKNLSVSLGLIGSIGFLIMNATTVSLTGQENQVRSECTLSCSSRQTKSGQVRSGQSIHYR